MNASPNITVYTLPTCQPCQATKRYLKSKNIPYQEIDLVQNPGIAAAFKQAGYKCAPIVTANVCGIQQSWSGFSPARLKELTAPSPSPPLRIQARIEVFV